MLVTLLSLFSFSGNNALPNIKIPHFDKFVHFSFYFGATILGTMCVWERTKGRFSLRKTIFWVVGFAITYGIIIEVLQAWFTSYRQGDILDVLANSAGALLAGLVVKWFFSGNTPLKWRN
ncbi:VanZ family protein [Arenibacter certesii]|uniref:VanZ family protein n=1 Tax=Arenibacter certesii TaxID=228955 RepID=UPI0003FC02BD|nr:VanZ family protein [Arenibacter certesii]